jgi:hypothetical protein
MNESQIISWIAQEQGVNIAVTQEVTSSTKDEICSDFQKSLSFEGVTSKRVFTIASPMLRDLACQVEVFD